MRARVLVLGLDTCDAGLIERFAAEGALPGFARLARSARVLRLANCIQTLPGAIWPELTMGQSGRKVGQFFHPQQIRTGESRLRPLQPFELDPEHYYWTVATRHGRRVAVVDQVQTVMAKDVNGLQLLEWGLHDRTFSTASEPAGRREDIHRRFGRHPITSCEDHGGTVPGYTRLVEGLTQGIEMKARFCEELLAAEPWDLFACTFAEAHCVGHQFWHFQDPSHPRHAPRAPEALREAMRTVYAALDRALSRLIAAAGGETTVFVVASHGMGPKRVGMHLLPELLIRLGLATDGRSGPARLARQALDVARFLPPRMRSALQRLARSTSLGAALMWTGFVVDPFESPRTRAAVVPNNRVGAIRINLKGREPKGCVEPGEGAQAIVALLRRELMALRDPTSGEPLVERVVTAEEAFGPAHHPDVPDVLVVFRTDRGLLTACVSPTVGVIKAPAAWLAQHRTGDHTPESRLWVAGPGIESGAGEANALDLAPTVLARLGVPLPAWLDGRPLAL